MKTFSSAFGSTDPVMDVEEDSSSRSQTVDTTLGGDGGTTTTTGKKRQVEPGSEVGIATKQNGARGGVTGQVVVEGEKSLSRTNGKSKKRKV